MAQAEASSPLDPAIDELTFENFVNTEARGQASPEVAAFLRSPEVVDRWYDTLLGLKRNIEVQLINKRAEIADAKASALSLGSDGKVVYLRELAKYEKWRAGAIRVLAKGLENRLAEAKRLRRSTRSQTFASFAFSERDEACAKLRNLRRLIMAHRDHDCGAECSDERCVADTKLWEALDTI